MADGHGQLMETITEWAYDRGHFPQGRRASVILKYAENNANPILFCVTWCRKQLKFTDRSTVKVKVKV